MMATGATTRSTSGDFGSLTTNPELRKSGRCSTILAALSGLQAGTRAQMRRQGVDALLFGKASVIRSHEVQTRIIRLYGYNVRANWPQAVEHSLTRLSPNDRVRAVGTAVVVVFLEDLSVVRLPVKFTLFMLEKSRRRPRRLTGRAVLSSGKLQERLEELESR